MGIEASILRQPPPCSVNYLFASWFNRGFLELRRIDWQSKRQQGVYNRISQTQMFQVANSNSPSSQLQQYAKENFHD
jgi:hypothetical protein